MHQMHANREIYINDLWKGRLKFTLTLKEHTHNLIKILATICVKLCMHNLTLRGLFASIYEFTISKNFSRLTVAVTLRLRTQTRSESWDLFWSMHRCLTTELVRWQACLKCQRMTLSNQSALTSVYARIVKPPFVFIFMLWVHLRRATKLIS